LLKSKIIIHTSITFVSAIQDGYPSKGGILLLGAGQWNSTLFPDTKIEISLQSMNRNGLIAGATGTGKTKTI
jgi:Cdc6-like AAA superfamily ATPase